jgi:hypothetical protein
MTPLYGFRIDLMGFRFPETGKGCRMGLDVVSSSHSTFFRVAPDAGFEDSADEFGVMLEEVLTVMSCE